MVKSMYFLVINYRFKTKGGVEYVCLQCADVGLFPHRRGVLIHQFGF